MRALFFAAKFFAFLWVLCAFAACAPYGPRERGEKIYRNVVFAQTPQKKLRLDLYVPKTEKPAPVVLWIFGGSWKIGLKSYHVNLRHLTRSGLAVAAIQYRLSDTAKYPAQIDDAHAAAAWLRAHGARYGVDPSLIGASGESAGGHLAALLGTTEGKTKIRAVCVLYPPTDLVKLIRQYESPKQFTRMEDMLGGRLKDKFALAQEASPVNHVSPSSPPFLFFHGSADQLVPLSHSQDLQRRLRQAGVEANLVVLPGLPHWFQLSDENVDRAGQFFQRHFRAARK